MAKKLLSRESTRLLIETGQIRDVYLVASTAGGFGVEIRAGLVEGVLSTERGQPRHYGSADTALRDLRSLGLGRVTCEIAQLRT